MPVGCRPSRATIRSADDTWSLPASPSRACWNSAFASVGVKRRPSFTRPSPEPGPPTGAGPARVTAESCLLTRGGDVVLTGTAAQARPEAVVRLLDDLLASCSASRQVRRRRRQRHGPRHARGAEPTHHAQTPPGGGGGGRPSGTGGRGRRRPRDGRGRRAGPIDGLRRCHRRAHASSVAAGLSSAVADRAARPALGLRLRQRGGAQAGPR